MNSVLQVSFLNHGTLLASSGSDGLIKIWAIKTQECISTLDQHTDKVWAMAVKKDESMMVSGSADASFITWNDITSQVESRKELIDEGYDLDIF